MRKKKQQVYQIGAVALCLLFSLVIHALLAWFILLLPKKLLHSQENNQRNKNASILVTCKTELARHKDRDQKKLPFAKTDPDQQKERPEVADFEGKRDTRASGESNMQEQNGDKPVPSQKGERAVEINTIDQKRQAGTLDDEGRLMPETLGKEREQQALTEQQIRQNHHPQIAPVEKDKTKRTENDQQENIVYSTIPLEQKKDTGDFPHLTLQEPVRDLTAPPTTSKITDDIRSLPARSRSKQPVYDPSLPGGAQPGFRTEEHRTRSTGRFVLGRHASLNVAATPRGKYEALIYRRIAYFWYIACDDHRGDIIPGSITIALRINKNGSISNMALINRHGASMLQQSFTFGAIRKATLPAMPEDVQKGMIGDLLEMIFTFNFD